jgi:hypothetical protein
MLPMEAMLPELAQVVLNDETLLRAVHGRDIAAPDVRPGSYVRLVDPRGQLVGIGEATGVAGVLHPAVVLR